MSEAIREGDIPGVQLRYRKRLPASAGSVWEWLTRSERQAEWLSAVVELDGDAILLSGGGAGAGERLVSRERVEGRRWLLSLERLGAGWKVATPLELVVSEQGEGAELMAFQSGFQHLALSIGLTEWERYRRRWREAFDRLEQALAATDDRP